MKANITKANIIIFLSIFIIFSGVIFLMCSLILEAVIFIFLGIYFFIKGFKTKKELIENSKKSMPESSANKQQKISEPMEPWQELKMPEPFKTITINPAGTTFKCDFSQFYENRQDVIKLTAFGTKVEFKQYTFKGEPAIALMHDTLHSDIGNVPRDKIEMVTDFLRKYDCVGIVCDKDEFYPDNDNDNFDNDDDDIDPIYCFKIMLYAYKRPELG